MRLISFLKNDQHSYGILRGAEVVDLGAKYYDRFPTLRTAIDGGVFAETNDLPIGAARYDLAAIELLSPISDPNKIICVGRNYRGHVEEAGLKLPNFPNVFVRFIDSLVPPGKPLVRPSVSDQFDFEGEIAIIIGRSGRHISEKEALGYVFGYSCFNDGTLRDYQFEKSLTSGKNFFASGSFGPAILTADEVPDPSKLTVETRLNNDVVQKATLSSLIFDISYLIAHLSRFTPLAPGDVIATGTPDGVGMARTPKLWMKPGDIVEVTVPGVGTLRNPVVAEICLEAR
jgi:2-keto-4-pentenoate hydratase/2-oxohepta-3-ene-1,7-dioic acid hydratase in catechol pathway